MTPSAAIPPRATRHIISSWYPKTTTASSWRWQASTAPKSTLPSNVIRCTVVGRKQKDATERTFLHRGIAARDFEQRFQLANHVKVTGATFDNGMLNIELVREVPEALKPRKIVIDGGQNVSALEQRQAA
jgi:hypothetical protein